MGATVVEPAHTAGGFLCSLILLFVAFPETLRKAQNEIDALLPDGRPPTMDDLALLPYVTAILREVNLLSMFHGF